jgi:hypothetical protein
MTAANAPSPFVISNSSEWDATLSAWHAFDDDNSVSGWHSANGVNLPHWIKIDLGTGKQILKYAIVGFNSIRSAFGAGRSPKNWTFEGSNDNTTWTVLNTQTNQTDWGTGEKRVYEFLNNTVYRYYRIYITANNGDGQLCEIGQMELMEGIAYSQSGATSLNYLSKDPSNILKDIIDKFRAEGGKSNYGGSSVALTGTVTSYQFNTNTVKEALDKINELAPNGWYYFVDATNTITFKGKDATSNHTFTLGKDIISIVPEKSLENMCNCLYFTGGDVGGVPIYKKYKRQGSIDTYGLYAQKYIDSRVTDPTTMDIIANSILDRGDAPETRTTLVIRDNNASDGRGYDIESIKPGDTCKVIGFNKSNSSLWDIAVWNVDKWDYDITQVSSINQQIVSVSYEPTRVTLQISSKLPNISHRVEDIKRNMDQISTNNNPANPS